jgi:hypothetical protein
MTKTYAEYLAESRSRPPSKHLAPPGARPKGSKGDNPLERERRKETIRRGLIEVRDLPITKMGTIDKRKMRPIRQKIYKVQEASHGR